MLKESDTQGINGKPLRDIVGHDWAGSRLRALVMSGHNEPGRARSNRISSIKNQIVSLYKRLQIKEGLSIVFHSNRVEQDQLLFPR